MARVIQLPEAMRRTVERWFGDPGRRWLAALPATAAALADAWGLRLGLPYTVGSHALVLPALRPDGSAAVLKIPFIDDENFAEGAALRAYDGDGAVRLYADDAETGALLLERAEPGDALVDHPDRDAALDLAFALLRRLRRAPPAGVVFPRATPLAASWAGDWPARSRRFRVLDTDLVDDAATVAEACADAAPRAELLINRDAHLGNVVRAQREPWLLIDPKPVIGEAAFEAGYPVLKMLSPRPTSSEARGAIARLAAGLGVDPDRVAGWALLRAVDNAVCAAEAGLDPSADLAQAAAIRAEYVLLARP